MTDKCREPSAEELAGALTATAGIALDSPDEFTYLNPACRDLLERSAAALREAARRREPNREFDWGADIGKERLPDAEWDGDVTPELVERVRQKATPIIAEDDWETVGAGREGAIEAAFNAFVLADTDDMLEAMRSAITAYEAHRGGGAVDRLRDLEDAILACEKGQTLQDVLANYRAVRRTLQVIMRTDDEVKP